MLHFSRMQCFLQTNSCARVTLAAASGGCTDSLRSKLAASFTPQLLSFNNLCSVCARIVCQLKPQCTHFCHGNKWTTQHPAACSTPSEGTKSSVSGSNRRAHGNAGTGMIMVEKKTNLYKVSVFMKYTLTRMFEWNSTKMLGFTS